MVKTTKEEILSIDNIDTNAEIKNIELINKKVLTKLESRSDEALEAINASHVREYKPFLAYHDRKCKICNHPNKVEIENDLLGLHFAPVFRKHITISQISSHMEAMGFFRWALPYMQRALLLRNIVDATTDGATGQLKIAVADQLNKVTGAYATKEQPTTNVNILQQFVTNLNHQVLQQVKSE